jgi:2-methylcitrate dehydratase PrpD
MLAGSGDAAPQKVSTALAHWAEGGCAAVVGTAHRLPSPWAALVNGTAAHALDYDDNLDPAVAHVSAVLVPALLALGEEQGASGGDCIDAYLIGFEVMSRLGEAMNMRHYQSGWHTTSTLGTVGAAAACARLLRLNREEASAALSLSTSMASGFKCQFGTMAKPLHAGLAAKNGITAAALAAAGLSAAAEAFDGDWGFHALLAGNPQPGLGAVLPRLGTEPAITEYGTWLKYYPCCTSAHQAIDALLELRRAHGLTPESIICIEVCLPEVFASNLMYTAPSNEMEARFSLEYCLAAALHDGGLTLSAFRPAAVTRQEVRALIPLIERKIAADTTSGSLAERQWSVTVTVEVDGGDKLTQTVDIPRGHPKAPLSNEELAEKFRGCAEDVLDVADATAALSMLRDLASLDHIGTLMTYLTGSAAATGVTRAAG